MANKILTPVTLWSDFDDSLPPDIGTLKEYERGKAVFSEITFSGRAVGSERVHIGALYARPKENANSPSLLVLPDCDKTYDEALAEIAKVGFDPLYGARPLKRAIQDHIENGLSRLLLAGSVKPGDTVTVGAKGDEFTFDVKSADA